MPWGSQVASFTKVCTDWAEAPASSQLIHRVLGEVVIDHRRTDGWKVFKPETFQTNKIKLFSWTVCWHFFTIIFHN